MGWKFFHHYGLWWWSWFLFVCYVTYASLCVCTMAALRIWNKVNWIIVRSMLLERKFHSSYVWGKCEWKRKHKTYFEFRERRVHLIWVFFYFLFFISMCCRMKLLIRSLIRSMGNKVSEMLTYSFRDEILEMGFNGKLKSQK